MERRELHTHTVFSDGADAPEAMVEAALSAGLTAIGFSDHAYTAFDQSYCMKREDIPRYRRTAEALKERYRGRITVLCGIEQDYYAAEPAAGYDYVIGSVHYLKRGDRYLPVDESAALLREAVEQHYGGDPYALAEDYYRTVADVVQKTGCTVIGHFDLITKFSEQDPLFDTAHPRYRAAWQHAAERLLPTGIPFEVNTGAMFRGLRQEPYPAREIREFLRSRGATLLPTGDCHCAAALGYCLTVPLF